MLPSARTSSGPPPKLWGTCHPQGIARRPLRDRVCGALLEEAPHHHRYVVLAPGLARNLVGWVLVHLENHLLVEDELITHAVRRAPVRLDVLVYLGIGEAALPLALVEVSLGVR
eukprot:4731868-Prymnesium_polylepis.1